jgi:hypothetical protein
MWIFTPTSFVSIVAHRSKPGVLLVRARLEGDLERLFPGCKVKETPDADYRFRAEIPRGRVADVIREQVASLDYPNVKAAIPYGGRQADLRHDSMHEVWAVMNRAQGADARRREQGLAP